MLSVDGVGAFDHVSRANVLPACVASLRFCRTCGNSMELVVRRQRRGASTSCRCVCKRMLASRLTWGRLSLGTPAACCHRASTPSPAASETAKLPATTGCRSWIMGRVSAQDAQSAADLPRSADRKPIPPLAKASALQGIELERLLSAQEPPQAAAPPHRARGRRHGCRKGARCERGTWHGVRHTAAVSATPGVFGGPESGLLAGLDPASRALILSPSRRPCRVLRHFPPHCPRVQRPGQLAAGQERSCSRPYWLHRPRSPAGGQSESHSGAQLGDLESGAAKGTGAQQPAPSRFVS